LASAAVASGAVARPRASDHGGRPRSVSAGGRAPSTAPHPTGDGPLRRPEPLAECPQLLPPNVGRDGDGRTGALSLDARGLVRCRRSPIRCVSPPLLPAPAC